MWEKGEIVVCIAVPDTCILAESNQLIKYSSPSNSQTEAFKKNRMASFSLSCSINWLVGHFWCEWPVKKMFILQGLLHPQALDGVL